MIKTTVQWHPSSEYPERWGFFGHGIHFHDVRQSRECDLVAFIEGFEWYHKPGQGITVIGYHIKANKITTTEVIDKMKKRVEQLLNDAKGGAALYGKINRRIRACGNC